MMNVTKYLKSSVIILAFGGQFSQKLVSFYSVSQEKLVRVQVFHTIHKLLSLIVEKEH